MAGRDKRPNALRGIIIRTTFDKLGDKVIKELRKHRASQQAINELRIILEQTPMGGKFIRNALREWADNLSRHHPVISSAIEPFLEDLLREVGRKEGEDDMAGKGRQNQKKGQPQSKAGDPAKGKLAVLGLPDHLRDIVDRALREKITPSKRESAYAAISSLSKQLLERLAQDMVRAGDDDEALKVLEYELNLNKKVTPEDDEADDSPTTNAEKSAALFIECPPMVQEALNHVMGDFANDSAQDQVNFNARMAALYGDGSAERLKKAIASLKRVAKLPIEERRTWFGVRPNYKTKIARAIKKIPSKLRGTPPTKAAANRFTRFVNESRERNGQPAFPIPFPEEEN